MNKAELFGLYKRVMRKDREAEDRLIAAHALAFPRSPLNKGRRGEVPEYRTDLHTMYGHLYRRAP